MSQYFSKIVLSLATPRLRTYFHELLLYRITCTGVVFRGEGVEHGQAVGVENGLDLRGPETEAQRRHGIRRGLLRVDDRIGSGRLALSRFIPLFGNGDEVLQRVDQRGLAATPPGAANRPRRFLRAAASVVRVFLGLRAVAVKIIERAIRVKMYFFIVSFLLLLD